LVIGSLSFGGSRTGEKLTTNPIFFPLHRSLQQCPFIEPGFLAVGDGAVLYFFWAKQDNPIDSAMKNGTVNFLIMAGRC